MTISMSKIEKKTTYFPTFVFDLHAFDIHKSHEPTRNYNKKLLHHSIVNINGEELIINQLSLSFSY